MVRVTPCVGGESWFESGCVRKKDVWCSGLTCLPVTEEIEGSNPFISAKGPLVEMVYNTTRSRCVVPVRIRYGPQKVDCLGIFTRRKWRTGNEQSIRRDVGESGYPAWFGTRRTRRFESCHLDYSNLGKPTSFIYKIKVSDELRRGNKNLL